MNRVVSDTSPVATAARMRTCALRNAMRLFSSAHFGQTISSYEQPQALQIMSAPWKTKPACPRGQAGRCSWMEAGSSRNPLLYFEGDILHRSARGVNAAIYSFMDALL